MTRRKFKILKLNQLGVLFDTSRIKGLHNVRFQDPSKKLVVEIVVVAVVLVV